MSTFGRLYDVQIKPAAIVFDVQLHLPPLVWSATLTCFALPCRMELVTASWQMRNRLSSIAGGRSRTVPSTSNCNRAGVPSMICRAELASALASPCDSTNGERISQTARRASVSAWSGLFQHGFELLLRF